MKVLSIRQPWAAAIIHAGKDIENRVWGTSIRGPVLIHATRWASEAEFADDFSFIKDLVSDEALLKIASNGVSYHPGNECRRVGQIIGSVHIEGCVTFSPSPWFFGPYGFLLKNPRRCEPITIKGKLGFWEYSGEVRWL